VEEIRQFLTPYVRQAADFIMPNLFWHVLALFVLLYLWEWFCRGSKSNKVPKQITGNFNTVNLSKKKTTETADSKPKQ